MKLHGAIILLDQLRTSETIEKLDPLFQEALGIGIEGLTVIQQWRNHGDDDALVTLPGETKEGE